MAVITVGAISRAVSSGASAAKTAGASRAPHISAVPWRRRARASFRANREDARAVRRRVFAVDISVPSFKRIQHGRRPGAAIYSPGGPGEKVRCRCLMERWRGAGAGTREGGLPGMAQAGLGDDDGHGPGAVKGGEAQGLRQGRATEQQGAIAAFFPQCMVLGAGDVMLVGAWRHGLASLP